MADKKKLMVVAALVLVVISVGAFQFAQPGTSPKATAKKKTERTAEKSEEKAPEETENPIFAQPLKPRDPFQVPVVASAEPAAAPAPEQSERRNTRRRAAADTSIPPLPVGGIQPLPGAIGSGTLSTEPMNAGPASAPKPEETPFAYTVAGVIVGERPAAVFADGQGNQRLVRQGAKLDGDTHVLNVSRGEVVIEFRGKTLRIKVGGNPNAN
jgi:hypothetical protein